jgi:uncharacterized membrane protein
MKNSRKYQNIALTLMAMIAAALWYSTESEDDFLTVVKVILTGLLFAVPIAGIYLDHRRDKERLG